MGVTVSYTAIPPTSNLYKRLQQEKSLFVIAVDLFMTNAGLFESLDYLPRDDDVLSHFVERYPKLFKAEMDVDIAIAELRWETMEACKTYQGVKHRSASLEKISSEVEDYLTQALTRLQISKPREIALGIMSKYSSWTQPLGLIARASVQKGAALLRQIDLKAIEFQEDWHQEELQEWIDFYLAVEKNKEEILIIVL
jgi:hypothetical protein